MQIEPTTIVIGVVTGVATGFLTGILTTAFSTWVGLWRFKKERLWERKLAAYESLMEALSDASDYYERELAASGRGSKMPELLKKDFAKKSREADTAIGRIRSKSALLLSDDTIESLKILAKELETSNDVGDWIEYLDRSITAYWNCEKSIREFSKKDLQS